MIRVSWYLSKMLLLRWVFSAVGMVILIGFVDTLSKTDEFAETTGGTALDYTLLRAPIIFDQIFIFTLAIAILLTFVSLIRRNELVALQSFGLSPIAQLRIFAPVIILISVLAGVVIDTRLPSSVRALNVWGIADYKGGSISPDKPLQLNDQAMNMTVSIEGREGADRLVGLSFLLRTDTGTLRGVEWADDAEYREGVWHLNGVTSTTTTSAAFTSFDTWQTQQSPDLIDRLASEPRHLSISDLNRFEGLRGSGSRPSSAYRVWRLKRLTLPLTGLAILMLCVAMMQRLGRRDNGTVSMVITLGISFVFIIMDGIAATLGAKGGISPLVAALGLSSGLIVIGIYLTLQLEILD